MCLELVGDSLGSLSVDYDVDYEEIEQLLREYFTSETNRNKRKRTLAKKTD